MKTSKAMLFGILAVVVSIAACEAGSVVYFTYLAYPGFFYGVIAIGFAIVFLTSLGYLVVEWVKMARRAFLNKNRY